MVIVPIFLLVEMSQIKRRLPPPKNLEKIQRPETSVKKMYIDPEIKPMLITAPKLEKIDDVKLSIPEEIKLEEEILIEEQLVEKIPEEQQEEFLTPEPQITNCSFCGLEIKEVTSFCPQCGKRYKKK